MLDFPTGLNKEILDKILGIVTRQEKVEKVVLFGSRALQEFKNISDIDLAIFGKDLTSREINLIHDALEENVSTPLKFDIVHFDSLKNQKLKEEILREGVCLYESKTH